MTRRYVVAGAAALAVVLLFFLFLLKPKFSAISDTRKKVEAETEQTQSLQLTIRQLQQAQHDEPATRARLAKFNQLLPATPDLPSLIRELQDAATASGMELNTIAPSPPGGLANATGVSTVAVNIQVVGGFFRLETFLTRLEDLKRVLQITAIAISPQTDPITNLTTLGSTITFQMYVVQPNATITGAAPPPTTSASPAPTASPTK